MSSGLYTQPQFQPPQYPAQPQFASPPQGGSNWIVSLMLIAGGVLLLFSLLIVAAIWWAVSSVEGWMMSLGREGVVAIVEESDIPPAEKKEVVAQVDRVMAAFKSGEMDQDDLERLLIGLEDSPLMTYISFYGMKDYYIEDTNLPEDKQAELHLAWKRAAYGMFTGKISTDEFYDSLPYDDHLEHAIDTSEEEGNELMIKWIGRMKKLADDAGVPSDPPDIDIGDEAKKLVDELLADGR